MSIHKTKCIKLVSRFQQMSYSMKSWTSYDSIKTWSICLETCYSIKSITHASWLRWGLKLLKIFFGKIN